MRLVSVPTDLIQILIDITTSLITGHECSLVLCVPPTSSNLLLGIKQFAGKIHQHWKKSLTVIISPRQEI